jgi:hypothetical protein
VAGQTAILADTLHDKNIALAALQVPATTSLPPLLNAGILGPRHLKLGSTAFVPATAADMTPQVTTLSKADGIAVAMGEPQTVQLITTARQQGLTSAIAVPVPVLSAQVVNADLKGATTNLYGVSPLDHSSQGYSDCLAQVKSYSSAQPDDQVCLAWMATRIAADVAGKISGTVTRASLLSSFQNLSNYTYEGMTSPITFTKKSTVLGGTLKRVFPSITAVYAYKWSGTDWQLASTQPVFPFTAP